MGLLLLVAETDPENLRFLAEECEARGHEVLTARTRSELAERLERSSPDALFVDVELTAETEVRGNAPLVLIAPTGCTASTEALARSGAQDVLPRRASSLELALCLHRISRLRNLARERDELRALPSSLASEILAGSSPAAAKLRERIGRVAGTPHSTVLVTGEASLENGLVARAIHGQSSRASGPFRVHACAASDPGGFESVLVGSGHLEGLLSQAAGGTLHVEEVAALAPKAQDLLVDILRDRTFRPGRGVERPLEARIIASTCHDLEAATGNGSFREDLFYRLNVLSVPVPPLRTRHEDLAVLARGVLRRLSIAGAAGHASLSPAALTRLAAHDWPGGLWELRATLERAAFLARGGSIHPGHLGMDPLREAAEAGREGGAEPPGGDRSLRATEERLIRAVLAEEGGNRTRTARALGINRSTLYNKLRQYGIG